MISYVSLVALYQLILLCIVALISDMISYFILATFFN